MYLKNREGESQRESQRERARERKRERGRERYSGLEVESAVYYSGLYCSSQQHITQEVINLLHCYNIMFYCCGNTMYILQ